MTTNARNIDQHLKACRARDVALEGAFVDLRKASNERDVAVAKEYEARMALMLETTARERAEAALVAERARGAALAAVVRSRVAGRAFDEPRLAGALITYDDHEATR